MDEVTVTVMGQGGAGPSDLTVRAAADARTADVLAALRAAGGDAAGAACGPVLADGAPVDPMTRWGDSGVRHGSVLTAADAGARPSRVPSGGRLQLRAVAGPAAGALIGLGAAPAVLGRDAGCDLVLGDPEVSRRHAEVTVVADAVRVRDLDSTNGLAVEGVRVLSACLAEGALLTCGESLLAVTAAGGEAAAVLPGRSGVRRFNRPPRWTSPPPTQVEVVEPAPPSVPERGRLPWVAVLVPIALGGVLFLTMPSSPQYLLLMAMSPLMLVGNLLADGTGGRRRLRASHRRYAVAQEEAAARLTAAVDAEVARRRAAAPDPAELLVRATLPSTRLWERRSDDPDAVTLRLGLADQPADVVLRPAAAAGPAPVAAPVAGLVPVLVPMDEVGVLGVSGPAGPSLGLTRWLTGQAAALLSPEDLTVVLLTTESGAADWPWLRWLPHARPADRTLGRLLVGADAEARARRVSELSRLVEARRAAGPHRADQPPSGQRRVLLVVDRAHELQSVPGLAELLERGPGVGVLAVCRDSEERFLPQACRAVASFEQGSGSRLRFRWPGGQVVPDVLADQVRSQWADTVSRALAGLEVGGAARGTEPDLPATARLLDLVGLPSPSAAEVAARWTDRPPTTTAVIGVSAAGPLSVDLSVDGPHALVAGTTGAGKSELLQTLVASLAIANSPQALNFVLVDYKGGAAFRECARLPHTVGLVTDLDEALTRRALTSLTAELRRRERVLASRGAKDIEALWAATTQGEAPALTRLVIVVDEFATLVEELPEFVRGLVGLAQRGRSLGIHLVLATQRPGGVVSPDIRANTNLRICLRVTHVHESSDVIDSPAAAEILAARPGRAQLRTGAGSLVAFQTARVGGPAVSLEPEPLPRVEAIAFGELGHPAATAEVPSSTSAPSDLCLLVEALRGAHQLLGGDPPRRPWLDPLPELVTLDRLPPGDDDLPLGLLDLPAEQRQVPYGLSLAGGGHLLVAGAPRSGRSSVLYAVAGSVARRWSPDDVHVYGLDFGNAALAPLAGLPHCGAVVTRDQPERLHRLMSLLLSEVAGRQTMFAGHGYADLAEQRRLAPPGEALPWMLLLVDRWEGLLQTYQEVDMGRRVDELLRLLREGPAVGLRAVVTTDRSGLLGRLSSVMPDRLVLRLADRADYALADIPAREVPGAAPAGRGLVLARAGDHSWQEVQVGLLEPDSSGPAQVAAMQRLGREAIAAQEGHGLAHPPIRVDPLPRAVTVEHALALGPTVAETSRLWALIGVGGDQLRPVGVDLAEDGPGFLVAGTPRSGRSTTLVTMAESLLRHGHRVCLVSSRRSPLAALATRPGVTALLDADADEDDCRRAWTVGGPPPVVVVDDAERLTDTAVGAALEQGLRCTTDTTRGPYVLAAGNSEDLQATFRGFTLELRRSRCGLLLDPQSTLDGDLVGARLPRTTGGSRHVGRALLAVRGELTPVQVAQP